MKILQSSLKELPALRTPWQLLGGSPWVAFGLLALFSSGFIAAAEPSWREISLDPVPDAAVRAGSDSVLPATAGLIAPLGDQTQCRVGKHTGVKGVIAMSDAGLAGPFLALWWDESAALTATVRTADLLPVESFTLGDGKQKQLILVRRGATIYAYVVESSMDEPLIAVDFPSGSAMVAGALVDKDSSGQAPAMSPVMVAPTLTGDVLLNQPATQLAGAWISEDDPGSLAGSHLLNRGDDAEASIAVRIENLLPGTHELWIRHAAAQSRTQQAEVTVEGFRKPVSLVVNQRISGGIWLALGRFETVTDTTATISLKSPHPGSGTLSMDGVHEVWSEWKDEDQDEMPDVLEQAIGLSSKVKDSRLDFDSDGVSALDEFRHGNPSLAKVGAGSPHDGDKAVFYVHETLGNDAFDGRFGKPLAGAWFSIRGGPKKTVGAALNSASRSAKVIELHLDGRVEPPVGGFQNLGDLGVTLIPGKNGASFESLVPPQTLPIPTPPRMLEQPGTMTPPPSLKTNH